jgi:hypothetical protein
MKFVLDWKLIIFVFQPDTFIKETFVHLLYGYFFVEFVWTLIVMVDFLTGLTFESEDSVLTHLISLVFSVQRKSFEIIFGFIGV